MAKNTPKMDFNNLDVEFTKEIMKERKEFLDDLSNFKLNKELEKIAYPLKRGERKKHKELINKLVDDVYNDELFDEFVSSVLIDRGLSDEALDEVGYDEFIVLGKRLLLTSTEVEYIVKKK